MDVTLLSSEQYGSLRFGQAMEQKRIGTSFLVEMLRWINLSDVATNGLRRSKRKLNPKATNERIGRNPDPH